MALKCLEMGVYIRSLLCVWALGGGLVVVGWAWLGRRSFCGLKTSNIKVIELLRLL